MKACKKFGSDQRIRTFSSLLFVFASIGPLVACSAGVAHGEAAIVICGDATGDGSIKAPDALVTLKVAVGVGQCAPPRCDANESGSVTASDAKMILAAAVGQEVILHCPVSPDSTTTTSTTSTSLAASCGNEVIESDEDCDPPQSFCRGGCNPVTGICVDFMCMPDCRCAQPRCGDDLVDPGESCDPPGSPCENGTCTSSCGCEP